ncbi:dentin sialophosphoprotein-like [Leptopilina boulardi]|uniref:dentin sialophosphoprotein-like n=1 Tax=Leptopilina boulardi TaxID=63433 RepID=UPI0021F536C6|nr:dentin sialophosphoprotein-like [Leptopilina boulardi]
MRRIKNFALYSRRTENRIAKESAEDSSNTDISDSDDSEIIQGNNAIAANQINLSNEDYDADVDRNEDQNRIDNELTEYSSDTDISASSDVESIHSNDVSVNKGNIRRDNIDLTDEDDDTNVDSNEDQMSDEEFEDAEADVDVASQIDENNASYHSTSSSNSHIDSDDSVASSIASFDTNNFESNADSIYSDADDNFSDADSIFSNADSD